MKLVTDLIANEKYHYVELNHQSRIEDKLWEIGSEIKQCNLLEITYQKQTASKEKVKRIVQPVAVLFSEFYFYLNAYIVEKNDIGTYVQKYNYPAIFRIDRILDHREIGEKFKIAYADRFEEGEFRKRVQFMFAGELVKLQFRYTGMSREAVLDRLPTARVVSEDEDSCIIKAEVYGRGILMWLLSQGSNVEVLKPLTLRNEMKQLLQAMLEQYD
jgi:predicted DNA-binding transcriptional regulator YafY